MGYTTDFSGEFEVTPPLSPEHAEYLAAFAGTRRMKRNAVETAKLLDTRRAAVGLPVGPEGAYFVGSMDPPADASSPWDAIAGQAHTPDIVDYNVPPSGQPGLWCQWTPGEDGMVIEWDGGEKFYNYVEWLEYLLKHFLKPWGYKLNGEVRWQGEDSEDMGMIRVTDNKVEVGVVEITFRF